MSVWENCHAPDFPVESRVMENDPVDPNSSPTKPLITPLL
jgi:hypothetical protein